MLLLIYLLICL